MTTGNKLERMEQKLDDLVKIAVGTGDMVEELTLGKRAFWYELNYLRQDMHALRADVDALRNDVGEAIKNIEKLRKEVDALHGEKGAMAAEPARRQKMVTMPGTQIAETSRQQTGRSTG